MQLTVHGIGLEVTHPRGGYVSRNTIDADVAYDITNDGGPVRYEKRYYHL